MSTALPSSPFGRVASAIVTPMREDGSVDLDGLQKLAAYLVDNGHDGLVVNGTTGEAPTTTDAEKVEIIKATIEAVGDRARITAGAGTNVTAHTVELVRQAEEAGAHAVLVVTPYYNKPPQAGIVAHFRAAAAATGLPVMLYDIPGRSGVPIAEDSLLQLAEHPRIQAVKDAKGDYWQAARVMSQTDLLWFSGNDADNVTHFANGATGFVGVTSQVAPREYAALAAAAADGDLARMREIHRSLVPLVDAVMNVTQGAIAAKAGLHVQGLIATPGVRLPLVPATADETDGVRAALEGLAK
ncbi:MAG: 4-hydroxy-tetrahydrodipicolinate synthase [Micrococcales bacterium]|nr:4-hydroxy-tetrahydrodipicolinate synthase [Micrococcales bacterium]